jgi:hypothetical protein
MFLKFLTINSIIHIIYQIFLGRGTKWEEQVSSEINIKLHVSYQRGNWKILVRDHL